MPPQPKRNRAAIWTARFIPAVLIAVVAYIGYVIVGPLSVNYLIRPPRPDIPSRFAAGIAIPVVSAVLVIPAAAAYLRLLVVVWSDPGYTPLGVDDDYSSSTAIESRPGLQAFWLKDVFVCDPHGFPIWCDYCQNWKPDRAHHSQDVGRCTRKMDHFCPWVGGVVGERAWKFFVQFLLYSMLVTSFVTIVLAYFVAQYKDDVQIIVALALTGFFLLFSSGMVVISMSLVFQNLTTIEHAGGSTYLAVLLPPHLQHDPLDPPPRPILPPPAFPSESQQSSSPRSNKPSSNCFAPRPSSKRDCKPNFTSSDIFIGTITYPFHLPVDRPPLPAPTPRSFAILHTPPGLNPWNLGSPYQNFSAIFGTRLHEWILPLRFSPCCDHSSRVSDFPLGPEFELLLQDAGLVQKQGSSERPRTSSRKRKPRLDPGWQNGERPDGWISEKEARRLRNEWRRRAERVEGKKKRRR